MHSYLESERQEEKKRLQVSYRDNEKVKQVTVSLAGHDCHVNGNNGFRHVFHGIKL